MNIKVRLRSLLTEGAHKANKFGCVMVFLTVDKAKWKKMQDIIEDDDLYLPEGESGFGKEKAGEEHVTILYGLHTDIDDKEVIAKIEKIKTPKIKLGKVSAFENPKFDVLKFDIISKDLHKLNDEFKEFPYTSDYPDYHPHVTIAYVKAGTAKKYIDKLNKVAEIEVEPKDIVYSRANGKKTHHKLDN